MPRLKILDTDPLLLPYGDIIEQRHDSIAARIGRLTAGKGSLSEFANGYLYYGLNRIGSQWVFREYAPNATAVYLLGDFNAWEKDEYYRLHPLGNGDWEGTFCDESICHGQFYKLLIEWQGGYHRMHGVWFKTSLQRYSALRCGTLQSLSCGKTVVSTTPPTRCLYTNATSVWLPPKNVSAHTTSLERTFYRV